MAYERIQVVGNIGKIERRIASSNGECFIAMRVAVDRTNRNKTKQTVWYEVILFGGLAKSETFEASYSIGREVLVEGRPQVDLYTKADGSYGLNNIIIASSMPELLGGRKSN